MSKSKACVFLALYLSTMFLCRNRSIEKKWTSTIYVCELKGPLLRCFVLLPFISAYINNSDERSPTYIKKTWVPVNHPLLNTRNRHLDFLIIKGSNNGTREALCT